MKFTTVTAVLGGAAAVSAHPGIETNAKRLARGLPPLPPARRGTPVAGARRSSPSGTNSCTTGPVQCCLYVMQASEPFIAGVLRALGIVIGPTVPVGLSCSSLSGGSSCSQQAVCCENNSYNLVALGCSSINI